MPTRRIMELTIAVVILMKPAMALIHLWSVKTLGTQDPGTLPHKAAEIVTVLS